MCGFQGFPPGALRFLAGLARNNRKEWFEDGFWFRLAPDRLVLGVGKHSFDPEAFPPCRAGWRD